MESKKDNRQEIAITMDKESAKIIDSIVSDAVIKAVKAIKEDENKRRKKQPDTRYHNTRILLENYKNFKQHCERSIKSIKQLRDDDLLNIKGVTQLDFDREWDEVYVKSIVKSSAITTILIKQIDTFLDYYTCKCLQSKRENVQRRIQVIKMLYINDEEKTYEEIAEELTINLRTVDNTRRAAIQELSALFFGIEGVKLS